MNPERMETRIQEIRTLLSHIESELSLLEAGASQAFRATTTDDLTGCLRRNAFLEAAGKLAAEDSRSENEVFAVFMLDLDHFKAINDKHGHAVGDEVLSRVGSMLERFSTLRCAIARWGGEEFAIAFRGTSSEAAMLSECVRSQIEAMLFRENCTLTASIGYASTQGENDSIDLGNLLEEADQALYQAKNSGRNKVCVA